MQLNNNGENMHPVNHSSFALSKLHEDSYQLSIQFSNKEKGNLISQNTVIFYQKPPVSNGVVWDVFSKDCFCDKQIVKKSFKTNDIELLNQASQHLPYPESHPIVAVFDIKHHNKRYLSPEIADSEKSICKFIQGPKPASENNAAKIHSIFHTSLPLDFVLCEGSLKKTLLEEGGFDEKAVEYLNSKSGSMDLCQCAEFFMNAFKLGHHAQANGGNVFKSEDYLIPVSNKYTVYPSQNVSTTIYPSKYKNIYAVDGYYASILSKIFTISGSFYDQANLTLMQVKNKQ